jgi:Rieske Fe-S protein
MPEGNRTVQQPDGIPAAASREADPLASRRRFLAWLIRASFAAFGFAFALPALALRTLSQARKTVQAGDELVYATGDLSGQTVRAADLQPMQAAQAFPKGKEDNQENLIELVRLNDTPEGLVAYSAICTHLGCTVLGALDQNGHILCPCHASLFDPANGAAVLRGPAGRALPSLPITVNPDGAILADGEFDGKVGPD